MEPRPDDIEEVLARAQDLAEALEASDRHVALRAARRAVENDPMALETFQRFDAVGRRVREAAQAGEEPDLHDREELDEIAREARSDPALWELLRCQADYVEMLLLIDRSVFRSAPRMGRRLT